ncbi:hypothetical protein M3Y99_01531000 [Aphelenchoides fujianensis]|nr:hypothetical protein M3Y99_01531000 [Aphelenchoides fujianensis]
MAAREKADDSDEGTLSTDDEGTDKRSSSPSPPASRSRERRTPPPASNGSSSSAGLSRFYRQRFGDHSPEDYMNLRVVGIKESLHKDEVRTILEDELRRMAPFEVKIVRNPEDDQRLAYVNFKERGAAKEVRRTMFSRLQRLLGDGLMLDPTGVLRDQEGKYIPDRFNRALLSGAEVGAPRRPAFQPSVPSGPNSFHSNNNHHASGPRSFNLNQNDNQATRTLFVGNLPGDIRAAELQRIYGDVEDIDVKLVNEGVAAYAFVVFLSLSSAMKALKDQHGHSIRPNSSKCQIGYGKSQVSSRLWIGGLGEWATKDMLLKEFDRFGVVEHLDYTPGASFAYIKFANTSAATDACAAMKNFRLHQENRIQVDYAKDKKPERKRAHSPGSSDGSSRKRRGPRTPSPAHAKSPAAAPPPIVTYEELVDQVACTWKGVLVLKKTEYPLRLHRVAGREHLLQELLRNEDGSAIKLKLDQRIAREPLFYDTLLQMRGSELAFMVGAEGSHSFTPMIEYLNEKKAIGMSTLPNALVYVLPHCALTDRIVKKFAPQLQLFAPDNNFLLVILKSTEG